MTIRINNTFLTQTIGSLAGLGTTISFSPQVIRLFRTKDIAGVSLPMFLIHGTGVCLWVVYGVLIDDPIVVAFNGITCVFVSLCIGRIMFLRWFGRLYHNDVIELGRTTLS